MLQCSIRQVSKDLPLGAGKEALLGSRAFN